MADSWRLKVIDASSGSVRGAAVLIADSYVLTCAHVVTDALGLAPDVAAPADEIALEPAAAGPRLWARVVPDGWFPATDRETGDLAVLHLSTPLPVKSGVRPALLRPRAEPGDRVRAYGFPRDLPAGVWSAGSILGTGGPQTEWVQINSSTTDGQQVEPGFSGSGVVDSTGAVVGLVVTAKTQKAIAWMLPLGVIASYWPSIRPMIERSASPTKTTKELRRAEISQLARLLDTVKSMNVPGKRQQLIDELPSDLSGSIERHPGRRAEIDSIVAATYDSDGGIYKLLDAVRFIEGGATPEIRELEAAVRASTGFGGRIMSKMHHMSDSARTDLNEALPPGEKMTPVSRSETKPDDRQRRAGTATAPRPMIWGGVPPQNGNFVGRSVLLESIRTQLPGGSTVLVPKRSTLQGMPGVGKTQIAIEYAHRYRDEYEIVWWVRSSDQYLIRRSLASLGQRLKVQESSDVEQMAAATLEELRLRPGWLLVYDAAEDMEMVRPYLPQSGGHVLITSRSANWSGTASTISVDVFQPEESLELMSKRGLTIDEPTAMRLADELGHLPLAVDQAAAWQAETGTAATEYLQLLNQRLTEILAEGASDESASVSATYHIAMDRVRQQSAGAAELLALCAFFSPEPISMRMLLRGGKTDLEGPLAHTMRDDLELGRAVRVISRSGVARIDRGRRTLQIHALVQKIIREQLSESDRERTAAIALRVMATATPVEPNDPETWPLAEETVSHVLQSDATTSADPEVRRMIMNLVRYLYAIGDFSQSRELAELANDRWTPKFGERDTALLITRRNLANALAALGISERARELHGDTYHRFREWLGDDNEHTMWTANGVGSGLRQLGKFQEAYELDQRNYERHLQNFEEDDPALLRTANNLGVDLRLLARFEEAIALDEKTVLNRVRTIGERNPLTIASYTALARDLYGAGRFLDAYQVLAPRIPVLAEVVDERHPWLLEAQRTLANVQRRLGQYGKALGEIEKVYPRAYGRFGPEGEQTLATAVSYFNTLRATGNLTAAYTLATETRELYEKVFGSEHPFTLGCNVNLGIILRAIGRVGEAKAMDRLTLDGFKGTLGDDHVYTLCAMVGLSNDLAAQGDAQAALDLSRDAYQRSLTTRTEDHPSTLFCEANFAIDLEANGELKPARAHYRHAVAKAREKLGPEHPDTVRLERQRRMDNDLELIIS
jgi:Trypsin-like peptidase domain/Tetratricopeptide repeat/NB-ARC domain/Effector-associated domain 2